MWRLVESCINTGGGALKCLQPCHKSGAFFASFTKALALFSRIVQICVVYFFFLCVAPFIGYLSINLFSYYCWTLSDFDWLIFTVFIYYYFCRFHIFFCDLCGVFFQEQGATNNLVCDWQVFPGKCQLSDAPCVHSGCPRVGVKVWVGVMVCVCVGGYFNRSLPDL